MVCNGTVWHSSWLASIYYKNRVFSVCKRSKFIPRGAGAAHTSKVPGTRTAPCAGVVPVYANARRPWATRRCGLERGPLSHYKRGLAWPPYTESHVFGISSVWSRRATNSWTVQISSSPMRVQEPAHARILPPGRLSSSTLEILLVGQIVNLKLLVDFDVFHRNIVRE